jgi:hypothetical protein
VIVCTELQPPQSYRQSMLPYVVLGIDEGQSMKGQSMKGQFCHSCQKEEHVLDLPCFVLLSLSTLTVVDASGYSTPDTEPPKLSDCIIPQ